MEYPRDKHVFPTDTIISTNFFIDTISKAKLKGHVEHLFLKQMKYHEEETKRSMFSNISIDSTIDNLFMLYLIVSSS